MAAVFASVDILLVALGYMLVWSKDLFLSEKIGVGVLGMLGLLLVVHLISPLQLCVWLLTAMHHKERAQEPLSRLSRYQP